MNELEQLLLHWTPGRAHSISRSDPQLFFVVGEKSR